MSKFQCTKVLRYYRRSDCVFFLSLYVFEGGPRREKMAVAKYGSEKCCEHGPIDDSSVCTIVINIQCGTRSKDSIEQCSRVMTSLDSRQRSNTSVVQGLLPVFVRRGKPESKSKDPIKLAQTSNCVDNEEGIKRAKTQHMRRISNSKDRNRP